MRKSNKAFFVFLLAPVFVLAGCSNDFSNSVTSLDDFLTVADAASLDIQSSVVKTDSGSSSVGGASSSTAASSSTEEDKPAHGAYLYANDNYSISNGSVSFTGYSEVHGSETDYFLIDLTKKSGFVTTDSSLLSAHLNDAKDLIVRDYAALTAVYDDMKTYVGKTAADYDKMTYLKLAYTLAGDAAGYTLSTITVDADVKVETNVYLTLDQIGGQWAFTNYSKRVTTSETYEKNGKQLTNYTYSVVEYMVNVVTSLSTLNLNLTSYSIYIQGKTPADIVWTNGTPLTEK